MEWKDAERKSVNRGFDIHNWKEKTKGKFVYFLWTKSTDCVDNSWIYKIVRIWIKMRIKDVINVYAPQTGFTEENYKDPYKM